MLTRSSAWSAGTDKRDNLATTHVLRPSFFVVGAQKAGTTSIHHYLGQHPDIFLPKVKETHFFSNGHGEFDRGLEYYLTTYFQNAATASIAGEVDPEYLYFPDACERIGQSFPDARIIAVLRNPVERAYSHYLMTSGRGLEPLSFADAIDRESDRLKGTLKERSDYSYVSRGYYHLQLQRFFERFGRENVLVVFLEDLSIEPNAVLCKLYSFLGVEPIVPKSLSSHETNAATEARWTNVQQFMLGDSGLKTMLKKLIPSELRKWGRRFVYKYNRRPVERPPLDDRQRHKLIELYRQDVTKLSRALGRDLSGWLV